MTRGLEGHKLRRGMPRTHLPMTRETWCEVFVVKLLSELEMFSLQKLEEK